MLKLVKLSAISLALVGTSLIASDVLVTVNGKNITKQDAQAFVKAQAPQADFANLQPNDKKMVVDRLVEKVLFTELAKKEGVDKKPEFKTNIEKIKEELLVNMWMKQQMDNLLVSASEAKDFYKKNSVKFIGKATMNARHILVKTQNEAKSIIGKLKKLKGKVLKNKFIELAKSKSTGPSGVNGGDLGTFSKGQMVPSFEKAVLALRNGHITLKPVKTQFGYHIIYLEKKTPAQTLPYEKIKDKIIASLKQQQFSEKIAAVAKELKEKATIVETKTK